VGAYCSAVWGCRFFWLSLVRMDLRNRYRGSVLGLGWSLAHPLAMTAIFTAVFCPLFRQDPYHYAPHVLSGLACWGYFVQTTTNGCLCFLTAEQYIRQHPAPLAIFPLRVVLGTAFHFLVALAVASAASAALWGRLSPAALLSVPATLVLFLLLGWSLAVLAGLAHVHFRDTRHLVEIGFQALFYLTPVVYRADLLTDSRLANLLRWNPFVPFLELVRRPLLDGTVPDAALFARACLIVAAAVSVAVLALARLERRLIFHL
jgi:lipopolysaccharide transport system permease protein